MTYQSILWRGDKLLVDWKHGCNEFVVPW